MNTKTQGVVTTTFGEEVLQESDLAKVPFPHDPPESVEQPARLFTSQDLPLLRQAGTALHSDPAMLIARYKAMGPVAGLLHLISDPRFNFNGVQAVRNEPRWLTRITQCVQEGRPVEIVIPLMCKIGNWAKVMNANGPIGGEICSLYFIDLLCRMSREIYAPGIHVHIVSDALFYNTAFLNTPVEALYYYKQLESLVLSLGLSSSISVHDFSQLAMHRVDEYNAAHMRHYIQLRDNPAYSSTPEKRAQLLRSTRACINTRQLGMTYEDIKQVFGPAQNPQNPFHGLVTELAERALNDQLAIKLAAMDLGILDAHFPTALRASCHKGLKNGLAVIGLRTHPNYYQSDKRLPYHGVACLSPVRREELFILPEVLLRADSTLTRIVDAQGRTVFYQREQ